jgi:archaellum component FlaF (FlaF/FlaG flagellin family)
METAIVSLIIITVALFGALTITHVYLSSQDAILASWREMEERLGERARTDLSVVGTEIIDLGYTVVVTLTNEGSTKLADFDQWDVIVQYDSTDDGNYDVVEWLSYPEEAKIGEDPPSHQWRVKNIYAPASTPTLEVFEPDIFNPREKIMIKLRVSPAITPTGQAIIVTPNGITAPPAAFTR